MRKAVTLLTLAVLSAAPLLPAGCGGSSHADEVIALLERRCGGIESISYACVTEDGDRLYREEFELSFPDRYRYRFYEYTGGVMRLRNLTVQSGNDVFRASAAPADPGQTGPVMVQTETLTNLPPLRGTGTYLALYHLLGNADYFQSMAALIRGGELEVAGVETLDGVDAFLLASASGLKPATRIWLDRETGLPLRKELEISAGRLVVFRFYDVEENAPYEEGPFPPDAAAAFGVQHAAGEAAAKDGACLPAAVEDIPSQAGFAPLLPQVPGFDLAGAYIRDPAASTLVTPGESITYPQGWREIYLVLRSGARQAEVMQFPHDPQFGYSTKGLGSIAGAFLIAQETFGADAGGAIYTAAVDCQEMRLTLGEIGIVVTGDLSREEMEALAMRLKQQWDAR